MTAKRRFITIAAWLSLLLVCLWLIMTQIRISTDLQPFLIDDDSRTGQLLAQLGTGPTQRLILIGIAGGTEAARAEASRFLAAELKSNTLFARVMNGADRLDEAERELIFSYRYLLSPADVVRRFDTEELHETLTARLSELQSALPMTDAREIGADPTQAMRSLLHVWQSGGSIEQRHGVWFSPDGERALLMVQTRAPAFDLDAQARAVSIIKTAFSNHAVSDLTLVLSGPPLFALASQETIRSEVARLSIAASVAVTALLWFAYGSWLALAIAMLPLASAVLVAMAVAGLLFGELYGITLGFGMTLLGVAADYPVHFFSHRRTTETVGVTLLRIWPILRLGVVSTALGYFAMITAGLPGLQQLGVFAVAGLLTAAAITRWLLPALLPIHWTPRLRGVGNWMEVWLAPRHWHRVALLMVFALLVAAAAIVRPPIWADDPAALNPIPASAIARYQEFQRALNVPEAGHLAVITADQAETALRYSESLAVKLSVLEEKALIDGFDMAARYLPSHRTQQKRQTELPSSATLEAHLRKALAGLPFKDSAFAPFLEAVESSRELPPLTLDHLEGTVLGARVESLLYKSGSHWVALVPLSGVGDPVALRQWFAANVEHAQYFDIKAEMTRLMDNTRDAALVRLALGILLIVTLLWLGIGSVGRTARVIAPVGLAMVATVAVLLTVGGHLTLFHVVSLLLVLGVNVDYSLFFSQPGQGGKEQRRTLHAILLCALSTATVFGLLALSTIPVLRAIGLTVAIGVCASFIAALVLARPLSVETDQRADD